MTRIDLSRRIKTQDRTATNSEKESGRGYVEGKFDIDKIHELAYKEARPKRVARMAEEMRRKAKNPETFEEDEIQDVTSLSQSTLLPLDIAQIIVARHLPEMADLEASIGSNDGFEAVSLNLRDRIKMDKVHGEEYWKLYVRLYSAENVPHADHWRAIKNITTVKARGALSPTTREVIKYRLVRLVQSVDRDLLSKMDLPHVHPYMLS